MSARRPIGSRRARRRRASRSPRTTISTSGGVPVRSAVARSQRRQLGRRRRRRVAASRGRTSRRSALRATAAYESYQGLEVLQGPDSGHLPVDLPHGHAADPDQRDLAGAVSGQAHHASRADAGRRRARDWRRPARSPARARDRRRARLAGRVVQHDGGRAADQPRDGSSSRAQALEQKNLEVDARRRYIETILERVATGVISLDAEGRISTVNGAAERLLGLDAQRDRAAGARRCSAATTCSRCCRCVDARRAMPAGGRRPGDHARARRPRDSSGCGRHGARSATAAGPRARCSCSTT